MASSYKRGKTWYACWKNEHGKWVRKALAGVTSKREADRITSAYAERATRIGAGLEPAVDNSAEVAPLLDGFLTHKLATTSYETTRHYASALGPTLGRFKTADGKVWPPRQHAPFDKVRKTLEEFRERSN